MQKSEFEFCLNSPIKYESGGTQSEGFKLILKAPSNRNRFQRALLKQQLMIAFQWMESQTPKNVPAPESKEQDGKSDDKLKCWVIGSESNNFWSPRLWKRNLCLKTSSQAWCDYNCYG